MFLILYIDPVLDQSGRSGIANIDSQLGYTNNIRIKALKLALSAAMAMF